MSFQPLLLLALPRIGGTEHRGQSIDDAWFGVELGPEEVAMQVRKQDLLAVRTNSRLEALGRDPAYISHEPSSLAELIGMPEIEF